MCVGGGAGGAGAITKVVGAAAGANRQVSLRHVKSIIPELFAETLRFLRVHRVTAELEQNGSYSAIAAKQLRIGIFQFVMVQNMSSSIQLVPVALPKGFNKIQVDIRRQLLQASGEAHCVSKEDRKTPLDKSASSETLVRERLNGRSLSRQVAPAHFRGWML